MQNRSLVWTYHSLVSVVFVVSLAAGCGVEAPPPGAATPFSDHADVWSGAIELDGGGELPVTLSLLTTDLDDEVAVDPASPYRWVFGRLELVSEGYALAIVGVARREPWSFDEEEPIEPGANPVADEDAAEPRPAREHLHFFVSSSIGGERSSEAYAADYASFLGRVGLIEPEWHSFDLSLELASGDALEGTFGELSTDELDAEGSAVDLTWKPRGSISLRRAGALPDEARPDDSTLLLDPFVFSAWVEEGELLWDVTVE